jgi:intracellular septation protein
MKILIDFFPILLFVGAYKFYDIYVGTSVLMAATVLQVAIMYAVDRKVPAMYKITLALVLIFGTLTLALHDDRFIKWKPTVLYGAMAIALAIALWGLRKNFLKMLMGHQLELPDSVWHRLNVVWVAYNAFMSLLNAYVVLNYSTEEWVSFKLWGYVFPLAFIIGQGLYIAPHLRSDEPKRRRIPREPWPYHRPTGAATARAPGPHPSGGAGREFPARWPRGRQWQRLWHPLPGSCYFTLVYKLHPGGSPPACV